MNIEGINLPKATIADKIGEIKQKVQNQPKVDMSEPADTVELSCKVKPQVSKGKKIAAGIASSFFPGLGQFINGDKMKGLQIYAGHMGIGAFGLVALTAGALPAAAVAAGILAVYDIANIVDAVKTAK